MASVDTETIVEIIEEVDEDEIITGKRVKYFTYQVKGNLKRIENRKQKWKSFGKDIGGAKTLIGSMQKENVWYSSYVKHKEMDIVQKMQKNIQNKDKKLEEFEKRFLDIDTGRTQEELRELELERKIAREEAKKDEAQDIDYKSVRVDNVPNECTEEELKEMLSEFGRCWRIKIPCVYNRAGEMTDKKKNFAFVHFETEEECKKAVDATEIEYGFGIMPITYANKPKERR